MKWLKLSNMLKGVVEKANLHQKNLADVQAVVSELRHSQTASGKDNQCPCRPQTDNDSNPGAHKSLLMCRPWSLNLLLPLPALWVCPGSSMTGVARACSRTTCTPSTSMLPPLLGRLPLQQPRGRTRGSAQHAYPSWLLCLPGTSGAALALHLTMTVPCSAPDYVRSLLVMP